MLSTVVEPSRRAPVYVGRDASAGRTQLEHYIQRLPDCLNKEIERQLPVNGGPRNRQLRWLSPLDSDSYHISPRADFLRAAGLSSQPGLLDIRWSGLGLCWDGLGLLDQGRGRPQGVLLVEAKSRMGELDESDRPAPSGLSPSILDTFCETREWLGAQETKDWTGPLYRTANRFAHLHLLRNHFGVPAWLVQVYFLNDPTGPLSRADWLPAIAGVNARLGLCRRPPFTLDVFLPALSPA